MILNKRRFVEFVLHFGLHGLMVLVVDTSLGYPFVDNMSINMHINIDSRNKVNLFDTVSSGI